MALRIDTERFRAWARLCADSLAVTRAEIDALNVFPVPDSDTGTNSYLTFAAGVAALDELGEDADPITVMRTYGDGLLIGARGNSGTILAELVRGSIRVLRENPAGVDADTLAAALQSASDAAYAAVGDPQEGTILTVAAAAARGGREAAAHEADPRQVFDAAAGAAREALELTTGQLDRLARAGVVDAGGRALVVVLDSIAQSLTGRAPSPTPAHLPVPMAGPGADLDEGGPAYEVMYLLRADDDQVPALRQALDPLGDSLVVVGGEGLWNIHVHVDDVGAAIEAGLAAGRPFQIAVTHFADQIARAVVPRTGRVVISAVTGGGLAEITEQAGAIAVPFSRATPLSVARMGELIDATRAGEIIVLPNREGHIAMFEAAVKSARDAGARVAVLPTTVQVQALAALAVYDPGRPFDDVVVAMSSAAGSARHGAVTIAIEDGITMAGPCRAGDVLGVVNGDFAVVGSSQRDVAIEVVDRLQPAAAGLVTIVTGAQCAPETAQELAAHIDAAHAHIDLEMIDGGQDDYTLLIAVE